MSCYFYLAVRDYGFKEKDTFMDASRARGTKFSIFRRVHENKENNNNIKLYTFALFDV